VYTASPKYNAVWPASPKYDVMLALQGAQFEPVEIKALQQQRGLLGPDLWRYIVVWRRKSVGSEEVRT
jgi:hypothetical protein